MRPDPVIRSIRYMLPRVALPLMFAPLTATADDFTLSLTDDSAKGQLHFSEASDELSAGVGYTYNTGSTHIANLDLHAQGRTAIRNFPMTVGLGLRNLYFDHDDSDTDGGALAPGGYVKANIPEAPGLSVNGSFHMSPSILSFGDADDMRYFELTGSYRLIRNAEVLAGYRYVSTDLDEHRGDIRLEEGFVAGMRVLF